jgi:stage IV sporulation protein FB
MLPSPSALVALAGARLNVGDLSAVESAIVALVDRLASVNLFLALFNMIPAFPMDGGRARARCSRPAWATYARPKSPPSSARICIRARLSRIAGEPILIFIAIFVYLAASSEAHSVAPARRRAACP